MADGSLRRQPEQVLAINELVEKLTAATIYVAAMKRLGERQGHPADQASSGEVLDKARTQLEEASRAVRRLQRVMARLARRQIADEERAAVEQSEEMPAAEQHPSGPAYRVRFLNHFARGSTTVTACQREVVIRSAKTRERAIEAAKERFAQLERIPRWHIHASIIQVQEIKNEPVEGTSGGNQLVRRESKTMEQNRRSRPEERGFHR